jgi:two-component system LytT family sensor kinase
LHVVNDTGLSSGNLIFFTAGLLITVLLLALTLRAVKLPGTPAANIIFAVCAVLWTAGGFVRSAFGDFSLAPIALALQLSAAGAFPISILAAWRAPRVLRIAATFSAGLIAVFTWYGLSTLVVAWYAASMLLMGAVTSLSGPSIPRTVRTPSWLIVVSVFGAAVAMTVARYFPGQMGRSTHVVRFLGFHLIPLIVLCTFLLFARFRYADVFVRYGVRILLAATWTSVLAAFVNGSFLAHLTERSGNPRVAHVVGFVLIAYGLLLSFSFVDERLSGLIMRWMFHPPDYRDRARQLGEKLRRTQLESEIAAAIEEGARDTLGLESARLIAVEDLDRVEIHEGEVIELDAATLLVPVTSGGRVSNALVVSPGSARPGLVTDEINFLLTVAAQCGNRLDALRLEREAVERESHESVLRQQVTEAELRALRAQINPHFLFNSLNTLADLIVRDPPRAETMTVRLADVFRHVLVHSARQLTSIRDEIDFLRTYLYIEETRFRDRLQVSIDVALEVADAEIPSLILQPIVENALKHGLGPKPGTGHLWISADAVGTQIRLRVEDDGLGLNSLHQPEGLGLRNVAERLKTLYRDRASVTVEAREAGGCRVTVLIPL